jgi:hypothetical protein
VKSEELWKAMPSHRFLLKREEKVSQSDTIRHFSLFTLNSSLEKPKGFSL